MLLATLAFIAVVMTCAMAVSKQAMLGFPSAMFWMLFGGQAYILSEATWDIYFLVAIASLLGMTFFSMFGAYALRTKKEEAREGDQYFDEGGDKDVKFIDEPISNRRAGVRKRMATRRSI